MSIRLANHPLQRSKSSLRSVKRIVVIEPFYPFPLDTLLMVDKVPERQS